MKLWLADEAYHYTVTSWRRCVGCGSAFISVWEFLQAYS